MSALRYHEIVAADQTIVNPFTDDKLALLGEVCRLESGQRMLDLACGKGEMLATWAHRYGIGGVGVDTSEVFLAAARKRLDDLGVADRVTLVHGDAGAYQAAEPFDLAACIGASWIGGGLEGTLRLLRKATGGLMLVGEPYWIEEPPRKALEALRIGRQEFDTLLGTLDRFETAGLDLVEMVLANPDSWDRYESSHWAAADRWLRVNPSHPEAASVREQTADHRRAYLAYGRRCLGWGVFVLRPPPSVL
jgi:SAM-dependent methyltransferase